MTKRPYTYTTTHPRRNGSYPLLALTSVNYLPTGFPHQNTINSLEASRIYDILTIHPFYKQLLGPIDSSLEDINASLCSNISQHDLHIRTDGSYNPSLGSGAHGWILANSKNEIWSGTGLSDGHRQLMTPYRAKLSGLVAGLHILSSICQANQLTKGLIHMYCDCEKAVKKITGTSYKGITNHFEPDSDLLHEARTLYKNLPVKISLQLVNGHSSGDALTIAQNLNHWAHHLAYNYLKSPDLSFSPSFKVIDPPSEKVSINYKNSTLTSNISQTVHHQLHNEPLMKTICKEANWDTNTFKMVD